MDTMTVKLVPGRRVRVPEMGNVVMGGREYQVQKNGFWLKKLKDGDVVIIQQQPKQDSQKPEKKAGDK